MRPEKLPKAGHAGKALPADAALDSVDLGRESSSPRRAPAASLARPSPFQGPPRKKIRATPSSKPSSLAAAESGEHERKQESEVMALRKQARAMDDMSFGSAPFREASPVGFFAQAMADSAAAHAKHPDSCAAEPAIFVPPDAHERGTPSSSPGRPPSMDIPDWAFDWSAFEPPSEPESEEPPRAPTPDKPLPHAETGAWLAQAGQAAAPMDASEKRVRSRQRKPGLLEGLIETPDTQESGSDWQALHAFDAHQRQSSARETERAVFEEHEHFRRLGFVRWMRTHDQGGTDQIQSLGFDQAGATKAYLQAFPDDHHARHGLKAALVSFRVGGAAGELWRRPSEATKQWVGIRGSAMTQAGVAAPIVQDHQLLLTVLLSWMESQNLGGVETMLAPEFDPGHMLAAFKAPLYAESAIVQHIDAVVADLRQSDIAMRMLSAEQPSRGELDMLGSFRAESIQAGRSKQTASHNHDHVLAMLQWMRREHRCGLARLSAPDFNQKEWVGLFKQTLEDPKSGRYVGVNSAVTAYRSWAAGRNLGPDPEPPLT